MQVTREVDTAQTQDWHLEMQGYAEHLDSLLDYLLVMSQHRYALCYYESSDQTFFKIHHTLPWKNVPSDGFLLGNIKANRDLSPSTAIFIKLKKSIAKLDSQGAILSASVVELFDQVLTHRLSVVLYSDHAHIVSEARWKLIETYITQQNFFAATFLENQSLKQKVLDLQEINAGKAKYFSIISHDLRAPFHGILGCADIILNEKDTLEPSDERKLFSYLYDTAQSTYGLLENLLNWSMSEGGKFHLKPINFRVNDVVQTVFDLLSAFAYKKKIKLQCDIDVNLYAEADVRMVTSILQNLASNALKFTEADKNKRVMISAKINHKWIEIVVEDEGVGMTYVQMNKLFQEHTIPSTQGTTGEKGTGLGFVLCRQFVEMNKGTISVESKEKVGTKFMVRLPKGKSPW